jgi:hypothetical protein
MRFRMESVHRNLGSLARFGDRRAVNRQFNSDSRHKWPRRTDKSLYQFLRSAVLLTVVENRRHDEGWWRVGVNGS